VRPARARPPGGRREAEHAGSGRGTMSARLSGTGSGLHLERHLPVGTSCVTAPSSASRICARQAADASLRAPAALPPVPGRCCLPRRPVNGGCLTRYADRGGELNANAAEFLPLCFRVAMAIIGGKRTCGLRCSTTSSSLPLVTEPRETGQPATGQGNCDTGTTEHGECGEKSRTVRAGVRTAG
jgi:hypothetical protein